MPYEGGTLGVVVVGVGVAWKVRIRDLTNMESDGTRRWKLLGYVSRRQLDMDGLPQLTEEEMFERTDVHAVVICTEPVTHEDLVRKALHCKKHVLVEYPVALSAAVTNELYQVAAEKGLVLHEENIALVAAGFATLQEKLQNASVPLVRGEIKLVGRLSTGSSGYDSSKWTTEMAMHGRPFCASISMVQTLYELFGDDLIATGGHFKCDDTGFTATAMLSAAKCRDLKLIVQRSKKETVRLKTNLFELEDGTILDDKPAPPVTPPAAPLAAPPAAPMAAPPASQGENNKPKIGLFLKDWLQFVREVDGERDFSRDTARVKHCIQLAEQIHNFMGFSK